MAFFAPEDFCLIEDLGGRRELIPCSQWNGQGRLIKRTPKGEALHPPGVPEIPHIEIDFKAVEDKLKMFAVGILGIGGIMGFALFLFLLGKGLEGLGIKPFEEEEEGEE